MKTKKPRRKNSENDIKNSKKEIKWNKETKDEKTKQGRNLQVTN
jgi:hypothetical protein